MKRKKKKNEEAHNDLEIKLFFMCIVRKILLANLTAK